MSSRRAFLKTITGAGVGLTTPKALTSSTNASEPIETIRFGLIGLGARGAYHLQQLLRLDGVSIKALCDINQPTIRKHLNYCETKGFPRPTEYSRGNEDYKRLLDRADLDAVIISTPWRWHTPMAIASMNANKHTFIEVPAAISVDECWQLVETQERTQRHCMMLENVCYGRDELMVLNMCRQRLFGDLLHGEGAYIHDLRFQMKDIERGTGAWRTPHHTQRNGNLYPTHGLGPIAQYMNINRGDRFDYMTSMSSPALGRALYARETFSADHTRNNETYIAGDINTSLIKTVIGRTIMLQWDTTTPRPYTRLNLIQGTRGTFAAYPPRIAIQERGSTHDWQSLATYRNQYEHPLWKSVGSKASTSKEGHGGMDFVMLWRLVYCLRNGIALDQDVYDAASWSVISSLSEKSVANRSSPVDIPDFTRGAWKTRKPLAIVS